MTILQSDARITLTDLAARVGLSKTPCQQRMKRLEQTGYIRGYVALLNLTKLGRGHIAFVKVKLSNTSLEALGAFNLAASEIPEIEQCHMLAADFDYLLKVRSTDMTEYRRILGEALSNLPYVAQTSTYVVMETVKDRE